MKHKRYLLAFLLGLAAIFGCVAVLKQIGVPVTLEDVTIVQAAGPASSMSFSVSPSADYSLDWYTMDGGGGQATGNGYQMTVSIGQADAVTSTGSAFTLQGGFLPGTLQLRNWYLPAVRK